MHSVEIMIEKNSKSAFLQLLFSTDVNNQGLPVPLGGKAGKKI